MDKKKQQALFEVQLFLPYEIKADKLKRKFSSLYLHCILCEYSRNRRDEQIVWTGVYMKYNNHCRVYRIKYFNVIFYLVAETEIDDYKINLLGERIEHGASVKMRNIHTWCLRQNIRYRKRFKYRVDYPVRANIWNFYSYCRFLREKISNKEFIESDEHISN